MPSLFKNEELIKKGSFFINPLCYQSGKGNK